MSEETVELFANSFPEKWPFGSMDLGICDAAVGCVPVVSTVKNGRPTAWQTTDKLDRNQGEANAGKYLKVGSDGNVVLVSGGSGEGGASVSISERSSGGVVLDVGGTEETLPKFDEFETLSVNTDSESAVNSYTFNCPADREGYILDVAFSEDGTKQLVHRTNNILDLSNGLQSEMQYQIFTISGDGITCQSINSGNGSYVWLDQDIPVAPETPYTISGQYSVPELSCVFLIRPFDSSGNAIDSGVTGMTRYNTYYGGYFKAADSVTVQFSSAVHHIRVGVAYNSASGYQNTSQSVSNVQFEMGASPTTYARGRYDAIAVSSGITLMPWSGRNVVECYTSNFDVQVNRFIGARCFVGSNEPSSARLGDFRLTPSNTLMVHDGSGFVAVSSSGSSAYASVAEMIADENLAVGDVVSVLGYLTACDGGAATYKIEASDAGYGIAVSAGYANIQPEKRMSPMQFGAVGDGGQNTDDTMPVQKCLDYCAERSITMDVSGHSYPVSNVKLYHNKVYDIIGSCHKNRPEADDGRGGTILARRGSAAIFLGDTSLGTNAETGLPAVRLSIRDARMGGMQTSFIFPSGIKDVHLNNSMISNVTANYLSVFFEGCSRGFTTFENCYISITDCAFRSVYVKSSSTPGQISYINAFVDTKFICNDIMGIHKFGTKIYYPKGFEGDGIYANLIFGNHFGYLWAIIGYKKHVSETGNSYYEINGYNSSKNIYSGCIWFAMPATPEDESLTGKVTLHCSTLDSDEIWTCDKEILMRDHSDIYSDSSGNQLIENLDVFFFNNIGNFNKCNIKGLRLRNTGRLCGDVTSFYYTRITNPEVYGSTQADYWYGLRDHAFDTKIPVSDYQQHPNEYKYTSIEPWNGRVFTDLPPSPQDSNYRYALPGQTCYYNNKLLTCRGDSWYDTMGTIVTE